MACSKRIGKQISILLMKKILLCILFLSLILSVNAQSYKTGIGVRGGSLPGLSIKHFYKTNIAVEGNIGIHLLGKYVVTGLIEEHKRNIFLIDDLDLFFGAGGHFGYDAPFSTDNLWADPKEGDYKVIGIDGILGFEYNPMSLPLSFQVDWKPAYNLIGDFGFQNDAALTIRYRIN
jgi:hypothetical protein